MTLNEQFATIISMIVMGIWVGAALTTYHRFIHPRKGLRWTLIITDILFWLVQALLIFLVLLYVNDGQIRFYIFLALLCGYAAYKSLLEKVYKKLLEILIHMVLMLARSIKLTITALVVNPIIFLLKIVYKLVIMLIKFFLTAIIFLLTILIYPLKWLYIIVFPQRFRSFLAESGTWFEKVYHRLFRKNR